MYLLTILTSTSFTRPLMSSETDLNSSSLTGTSSELLALSAARSATGSPEKPQVVYTFLLLNPSYIEERESVLVYLSLSLHLSVFVFIVSLIIYLCCQFTDKAKTWVGRYRQSIPTFRSSKNFIMGYMIKMQARKNYPNQELHSREVISVLFFFIWGIKRIKFQNCLGIRDQVLVLTYKTFSTFSTSDKCESLFISNITVQREKEGRSKDTQNCWSFFPSYSLLDRSNSQIY